MITPPKKKQLSDPNVCLQSRVEPNHVQASAECSVPYYRTIEQTQNPDGATRSI